MIRRACALLLLASCTPGPLEGGAYRCDFGGPVDQCPENWRCGLESYCHFLGDVSRPWRCNTAAQCEANYQCGLDSARDGGECHNPAVGVSYPCFADTHCTAGWHCGPEGRCYDRSIPTDFVCRPSAGDCADGWRCGLNGRCQNQDAGAPYACRTDAGLDDSWCEQGFRCAPEGQCLDPRQDALREVSFQPPTALTKINPLVRQPLERFSVGQYYDAGFGEGRQMVAWVTGGELFARVTGLAPDGGAVEVPLGTWDAGTALLAMGSRGETADSIAIFYDNVPRLITLGAAGLETIQVLQSGATLREEIQVPHPVTQLRQGSVFGDESPHVAAFSEAPDRYSRLMGGPATARFVGDFLEDGSGTSFAAVPNNKIVEMALVRGSFQIECAFVVDRRGLWVAQNGINVNDSWDFAPIEVPGLTNDSCRASADNNERISQLVPLGRDWLGYLSTVADAGTRASILDLRGLWNRTTPSFCSTDNFLGCTNADRIPIDRRMGPCVVCSGGQVLDLGLVEDGVGNPHLELRCGSADGGTTGFFTATPRPQGTGCDIAIAGGDSSLFTRPALIRAEQPAPGRVAWGSSDGFIWSGASASGARSELLDRAPAVVARRSPATTDVRVFTGDSAATFQPDFGLLTSFSAGVISGIANAPEWVVTRDRLLLNLAGNTSSVGDQLGVVGLVSNIFVAPFNGVRVTASNAHSALLVSAGSNIFSGEVEGLPPYPPLTLKAVAPSQIDSLAVSTKAPPGVYLRGYVVTPNGVLRLNAVTATQWGFEPISLPASLLPREVWFEDDRARVGFADGTVYSLPSRVPIASPLTDGVEDFAQLCGQQLALGAGGLFRLEAEAGKSLGQWKPIALGVFQAGGFTGARLHATGATLYVFKRTGEAARLDFPGCTAP